MMANDYGAANGAYLALANYRDGQMLKLSAAISAAYFIALGSVIGAALLLLFGEKIGAPAAAGFVFCALALPASFAAYVYARLKHMQRSMQLLKLQTAKSPTGFVPFFKLYVRLFIINSLCWYDKKLLAPAAISLALGIMLLLFAYVFGSLAAGPSIAGIALLIIAYIAWSLAYYIHAFRTGFAKFMLIRGDGDEAAMPQKSNQAVLGQTFEVFTAQYLITELLQLATSGVFGFSLLLCAGAFALVLTIASGAELAAAIAAGLFLLAMLFAFNTLYMSYSGIYAADVFRHYCPHAAKPAGAKSLHKD